MKHCNDSKVFTDYSNDMVDIEENIDEYNINKKWKKLIMVDDMIPDMLSNEKLQPKLTELYIRARKLNISLAFVTHS